MAAALAAAGTGGLSALLVSMHSENDQYHDGRQGERYQDRS